MLPKISIASKNLVIMEMSGFAREMEGNYWISTISTGSWNVTITYLEAAGECGGKKSG